MPPKKKPPKTLKYLAANVAAKSLDEPVFTSPGWIRHQRKENMRLLGEAGPSWFLQDRECEIPNLDKYYDPATDDPNFPGPVQQAFQAAHSDMLRRRQELHPERAYDYYHDVMQARRRGQIARARAREAAERARRAEETREHIIDLVYQRARLMEKAKRAKERKGTKKKS